MKKLEYKISVSFKRFLGLLVEYIKSSKRLVFIYLTVLLLDSFTKMFSVVAIIPLIDFLSDGNAADFQKVTLVFIDVLSTLSMEYTLTTSVLLFILAILLALLAEIFFYFTGRKNSYNISYYLTSKGMRSFFNRGLKFINSQTFGVIQNTFQREVEQISGGVDGILLMISSLIQILFMLFLAFSLSVTMTTVTLIIMFVAIIMMSSLNFLISRLSAITTLSGNELSQALFEPLMNAKQILSYGRSEYAFNNHTQMFKKHTSDALLSQTLTFSVPQIFRMLGIVAALVALYFSISNGEKTVTLVAALIALIRITPIAAQITSSFAAISSAVPSLNQFEKLFGYVHKQQDHSKLSTFNGFSDAIQLVDISYSHSPTRESISNINLNIPKNSYIAFVGPSGSGKTTCVDVIMGLFKPSSGNVTVDNQPLNEIDLSSFLSRVGYVQQTPFLFNGTIRDNLLWSSPSATESEMWDALHLANIDNFIRSTNQQLDTQVGDRGVALSGGQKQRIVLAQALIRKPDILVLDEATNSLDRESETSIIKTLQKISHNITIISITHNPFMTVNADQIFVFDKGRIIESGTYDELMSFKNSFLQKMNP